MGGPGHVTGSGLSTALPTSLWSCRFVTITWKRREFATNVVAVAFG